MSETITTQRRPDAHERAGDVPASTMSLDEYRKAHMRRGGKYGNQLSQSNDGKWFDSKAERDRYEELRLLELAGEISHLECQPVLELQPAFKRNGTTHRAITYRADFRYIENGDTVIEDVKGKRTAVFNIKWKLALARYPDYTFRIEAA